MFEVKFETDFDIEKIAKLFKKSVALAVRGAGRRYVEAVKEYVEKEKPFKPKTGELLQSVHWRPKGLFAVEVLGAGDTVKYGYFLEFGTKGPYVIRPRKRKALKIPTEGGYILRKKAVHPGITPRPWFYTDYAQNEAYKEFKWIIYKRVFGDKREE